MVLNRALAAVPETSAVLDYQVRVDEATHYLFFEVCGSDFETFEDGVETDPTVAEPVVVIDGGSFRVYRMVLLSDEHLVIPEAAKLGMHVLRAEDAPGGWLLKLEISDTDTLRTFRARCADRNVEFTLERLFEADDPDRREGEFGLTDRQRETLLVACEWGYFDEPRATSLEELADRLGVSPSAVSGRIRRGTRALIQATIEDGT